MYEEKKIVRMLHTGFFMVASFLIGSAIFVQELSHTYEKNNKL